MAHKKENRLETEPILLPINSHENKILNIFLTFTEAKVVVSFQTFNFLVI